jgi:hypothetical protein
MRGSNETSNPMMRGEAQIVIVRHLFEVLKYRFVGKRVTRVLYIAKTDGKGENVFTNLSQTP